MEVALAEWLRVIDMDYLSTFIAAGGAAVKCVVTAEQEGLIAARRALSDMAGEQGYLISTIDAATTRIHMIERLFYEIARQIDWDSLTVRFMRELLAADGFALLDDPVAFTYAAVAELNTVDEPEVRRRVRVLLRDRVASDYAMTREFRTAMLRLCQACLEMGKTEIEEAEAIRAWLRGDLKQISGLKFARIFQKVGRNNARDLFLSLTHWLRTVGVRGLIVTLDISRYLVDRRQFQPNDGFFYSTSATLDAYEVVRQFIDATSELESCLIVVLAPIGFLNDDKRGLIRYDALKLRIWEDVHDRYRANPLAGLVRLRIAEMPLS